MADVGLQYLGYPEDGSDVYQGWEASRIFLKQLYGAEPDDNLYLMQPSPGIEVELSKQEMQTGSYNVEKLPGVSTLQLLWRAYDCWDACTCLLCASVGPPIDCRVLTMVAVNYYEKATRVGSKVVSKATDTHLIARTIEKNRLQDARKTFYDPTNKSLVCLSMVHAEQAEKLLVEQWGHMESKHAKKLLGLDRPTAKQLQWLAKFYVSQFIHNHRIWGYIEEETEELLAMVFWEPKSSEVVRLSEQLPSFGAPEVLTTLGYAALRNLTESFTKIEKLRRDRTASTSASRKAEEAYIQGREEVETHAPTTLKAKLTVGKKKAMGAAMKFEKATRGFGACVHLFAVASTDASGNPLAAPPAAKARRALLTILAKLLTETSAGIFAYCWLYDSAVTAAFFQERFSFRVLGSDPILHGHLVCLWRDTGLSKGECDGIDAEEIKKEEGEEQAFLAGGCQDLECFAGVSDNEEDDIELSGDERSRLIQIPESAAWRKFSRGQA